MARKQDIGEAHQPLPVIVLEPAKSEGRKILQNDGQYWHVATVVKRLSSFGNLNELWDLRIEHLRKNLYELKLKGGLLGKINLRIYFAHRKDDSEIVVLKCYKKEEEGKVPRHILINIEDRLSDFEQGKHRDGITVFRAGQ